MTQRSSQPSASPIENSEHESLRPGEGETGFGFGFGLCSVVPPRASVAVDKLPLTSLNGLRHRPLFSELYPFCRRPRQTSTTILNAQPTYKIPTKLHRPYVVRRPSLGRRRPCHSLQRINPLIYPVNYDRWGRFVSTDRKGRACVGAGARVVSVGIRIDGGSPWAVVGGPSASSECTMSPRSKTCC